MRVVTGNVAVTDCALHAILKYATRLKRLDLRGCHIIGQVLLIAEQQKKGREDLRAV